MERWGENPRLGVAGAPFREGTFQYDYRFTNIENVWGGCQLFRRECFEAIGGYMPLKGGCIDHVAVLSARLHGWQTRTFTEKVCLHHRRNGHGNARCLKARFKLGVKDYSVGNHPLWELFRTIYQMKNRPYVIGGLALGSGYAWSFDSASGSAALVRSCFLCTKRTDGQTEEILWWESHMTLNPVACDTPLRNH